jgi:hypothetical protein
VGHQDYHQPEDDADKIEPEMLRIAGQFVLQGMVNLANETQVNLLIDRRRELYRALRMQIANLNPDLPNSRWSRVEIKEETPEALYDALYNRARELLAGSQSAEGDARTSGPPKKSVTRGLADLKVIGTDQNLLKRVTEIHGVGRLDVKGDDGTWVADGRLTDEGREGLKVLEENGIVVRLISPGEKLVTDLLSAASKPFVITGDYEIADATVDRLNSRGVLLGVDLDPQKVDDFITRLENLKGLLGERGNLFAYLTSAEGLEEAKQPLYLRLVDRGWTHNEICGDRGRGGLLGGGPISKLSE